MRYTNDMLGFNHTLAGSIIAVITPAPLVPVVAFASHFLLDTTPHFGRSETVRPYTKSFVKLLVFDAAACFTVLGFSIWLFPELWFIIIVGTFFSAGPDFLWLLRGKGPRWFKAFLHWASVIQWGERPYGWIFEAFYALIMAIALYLLAGQPWG